MWLRLKRFAAGTPVGLRAAGNLIKDAAHDSYAEARLITPVATADHCRPQHACPQHVQVIEMINRTSAEPLARSLEYMRNMPTVEITFGEIVDAMYDDLMETYGDEELALLAAHEIANEFLTKYGTKPVDAIVPTARESAVVIPAPLAS